MSRQIFLGSLEPLLMIGKKKKKKERKGGRQELGEGRKDKGFPFASSLPDSGPSIPHRLSAFILLWKLSRPEGGSDLQVEWPLPAPQLST